MRQDVSPQASVARFPSKALTSGGKGISGLSSGIHITGPPVFLVQEGASGFCRAITATSRKDCLFAYPYTSAIISIAKHSLATPTIEIINHFNEPY